MLLKFWAVLVATLLTPQTQVLNIEQAKNVLDVSVLIRIKHYRVADSGAVKYGMGGCSGTYITTSTVLTAAHCFGSPTSDIWVRDHKGVSSKAVLVKISPERDLALLSIINKGPHVFASVASSSRIGEQVINVGSPLIFEFLVSEGVVAASNFEVEDFKARYLITTAMINPGSSGGGAFNSKGELIGVNTMTYGSMFGWSGISMAVDAPTIRDFIK